MNFSKCSPWFKPDAYRVPLILFGKDYWKGLIRWMKDAWKRRFTGSGDLELFKLTDDPRAIDMILIMSGEWGRRDCAQGVCVNDAVNLRTPNSERNPNNESEVHENDHVSFIESFIAFTHVQETCENEITNSNPCIKSPH